MASNKVSKQVRRTTSVNAVGPSRAWLAAVLVQLAGSAVALGQIAPANQGTPAPKAAQPQPADGAKPDAKTDGSDKVHVDQNQIVDLHVNDEDLANVLEMLSIQSQRNIVASKGVSARVTANLYGVTFFEALDAILNVNGFGYIEQGNFIMVYTADEIKKLEAAQRVKISKMITLNYLNAIDAAEFVKPLLSEGAIIKTNGKTGAFPSLGEVPVGAEEFANSATIVVYDYEDHVAEIEALIKQLDTRPAQVLVEATILQTTLTQDNALGVDFALVADMNFQDFVGVGGPTTGPNALNGGRAVPGSTTLPLPADGKGSALASTPGNTAGPGDFKVGVVTKDLAFFLNALDEVTDTTILSNPKLLALNRQPSRVLVGRKVGYLSSTSTDTATTQTVEFLDTGTQLYFRPFVTNEGMIRMELKPQVSEAIIRQANDASGKTVTIPDEDTNEVVTNVMVHDGQTIVLGGLFRESTTSTRRQVPLLGDIPLVGAAFRGNSDNTQRNEIIFLITPSIVNDQTLTAQGDRGKEYVDHVRVGSREGVLFWSRDKLTSKMNVEAERLAEAGDTEGALWKVERSLSLNHFQPEVIGLRERLTNKKSQWPDRSFLNRVIDGETEPMLKKPGPKASLDGNSPTFAPATQTAESPDSSGTSFANAATPSSNTASTNFNSTYNAGQTAPAASTSHKIAHGHATQNNSNNSSTNNAANTNGAGNESSTTAAASTTGQATPAAEQFPTPESTDAAATTTTTPGTPADMTTPATPSDDDMVTPSSNDSTPPADQNSPNTNEAASNNAASTTNAASNANTTFNSAAASNTTASQPTAQNPAGFGTAQATTPAAPLATTPASNATANNQAGPAAPAAKQAPTTTARVFSGRHGLMGGMWSYFKFMAGHDSTLTQAKDSDVPESLDSK